MKILTNKKCDEILKRLAANEIIQFAIYCDNKDALTTATENRAEIAYAIGGIKGLNKVLSLFHKGVEDARSGGKNDEN